MRILITNDDGINAPGLKVLEEIAATIAGPDGQVWVVAPAFEQSGVGHCISYTHPTMIAKMGERRFAAEGSPADCVLAGIHDVMQDNPPDLVLSGVNRGNNSAENTLYSGTIGGAMEAALQGLPAIALSQYYGPGNTDLANTFEASADHGAAVVQSLLDHGDWSRSAGYMTFYNVNFPPCASKDVQGTRVVAQGCREGVRFSTVPHQAPSGRRFLWVRGGAQNVATAPDTDAAANLAGYISVTPMRADLTAHDQLNALKVALE
ncbi:5'/3'-nucleotidase SurE [Actibacterium sp. 188UL27-1]|uniref:5'/3'-nucleotidase SurE n=1 Tax=Actibacterium sp. 188UL27-1 TaxID=2786961 RepID=UPI00195967BA|nr:5'/3'-nucleotidase SurE [Actibacterium sp. 188UL27-1]MBM7067866.1 5'/3'-nucleotidase SurE [Actibacterium sp. 188UL27-1]